MKNRLEKLASLQCRLLEHAAKFQHVERIVFKYIFVTSLLSL